MTYLRLDKKFLFIHTTKCAGGTIEAILKSLLGDSDRKRSGHPLQQLSDAVADWTSIARGTCSTDAGLIATSIRCPIPMRRISSKHRLLGLRRFQTVSHHTSNSEIQEILGSDRWSSLHRFAVTRHPYERAVSIYFGHTERSQPIDQWLASNPHLLLEWQLRTASRIFGVRQSANLRIFAPAWDSEMTFLRFDALHEDIAMICDILKLTTSDFRLQLDRIHVHQSGRSSADTPQNLLSKESRALIDRLCEPEFERFGYSRY